MATRLLILIYLFVGFYAHSQTKSEIIRAYHFLEYYYTKIEKEPSYILINTLPSRGPFYELDSMLSLQYLTTNRLPYVRDDKLIKIDAILSDEDMNCMREQLIRWKNQSILDTTKFSDAFRKRIINHEEESFERRKISPKAQNAVFFPLFNCKGNIVMLYTENYCGIECGSGGLVIYQKRKNGSWAFICFIPSWVS